MQTTYTISKKDGTGERVVRFTRKRGQIFDLLKHGFTKKEVVENGYNVNTVSAVVSQVKRLSLFVAS